MAGMTTSPQLRESPATEVPRAVGGGRRCLRERSDWEEEECEYRSEVS